MTDGARPPGAVKESVTVTPAAAPLRADRSRADRPGPDAAAWAVVDLAAVAANVRALACHAPSAQVMAVVKADGYGHGLVPCARAAVAGGARWLGVAQPGEALALRAAGVRPADARILSWLFTPGAGAPMAELLAAEVDVSISAPWVLAEVLAAARASGRPARVHLKVDTGLARNGIMPDVLPGVVDAALAAEREGLLRVVGIWSHLALADEPDHPTIRRQADVFDGAVALAEAAGARFEVRHLANSAATLTEPRLHYDLVRPGLAVYGLSPVPQLGDPERFGLVPAMTLRARLANVKRVDAGQGVSYAHAYTTDRSTMLGLVPLGYADGIPRHASGGGPGAAPGGPVLVGSAADARVLRVAGRVCMDQFVLDLGPGARAAAGDVVTLFGPGTHGEPTAEDWAAAAGTISYEITTRLGPRVPRVYVGGTGLAAEGHSGGLAADSGEPGETWT